MSKIRELFVCHVTCEEMELISLASAMKSFDELTRNALLIGCRDNWGFEVDLIFYGGIGVQWRLAEST